MTESNDREECQCDLTGTYPPAVHLVDGHPNPTPRGEEIEALARAMYEYTCLRVVRNGRWEPATHWGGVAPKIRKEWLDRAQGAMNFIAERDKRIAEAIRDDLIEPTPNCPLDELERARNLGMKDAARIVEKWSDQ